MKRQGALLLLGFFSAGAKASIQKDWVAVPLDSALSHVKSTAELARNFEISDELKSQNLKDLTSLGREKLNIVQSALPASRYSELQFLLERVDYQIRMRDFEAVAIEADRTSKKLASLKKEYSVQ